MIASIYDRPEHDDLRRQVARFVEREVETNALARNSLWFAPNISVLDGLRAAAGRAVARPAYQYVYVDQKGFERHRPTSPATLATRFTEFQQE